MRRASGKSQKPSADRKFPVQLAAKLISTQPHVNSKFTQRANFPIRNVSSIAKISSRRLARPRNSPWRGCGVPPQAVLAASPPPVRRPKPGHLSLPFDVGCSAFDVRRSCSIRRPPRQSKNRRSAPAAALPPLPFLFTRPWQVALRQSAGCPNSPFPSRSTEIWKSPCHPGAPN